MPLQMLRLRGSTGTGLRSVPSLHAHCLAMSALITKRIWSPITGRYVHRKMIRRHKLLTNKKKFGYSSVVTDQELTEYNT